MNPLRNLTVQLWTLETLIPYARNARTHSPEQVAQIAASIHAFGFNNPVLIDPKGGIIAGHGRVLAARKLGLSEVPVIVLPHLSENQKRAFMVADNKLALNAGWDDQMLRLELDALDQEAFDLELTGFSQKELDDLLAQLPNPLHEHEVPAVAEQAVTTAGDIWRLGDYRVLCGDGTASADLQRVLQAKPCNLVFTDLPYNVNYCGKTSRRMTLQNDNLGAAFSDFLTAACQAILAVSQGPIYICMSSSELHRLYTAFTACGGHWSTYVIWAKNTFTLGRSDYQRQYEPMLYGWREGQEHFWCGARNQGDVWMIDKPRVNDLHPTMKPLELIGRAIENSSRVGDIVLDPFAGSGSTALACEQTGRQACMVEIDPCYVDVIVKRWQDYSGQPAYREQDGRSFDELAAGGEK